MKIFLINDYCRIDGKTAEFAEKAFSTDFTRFESEISLSTARNQTISFQIVAQIEGDEVIDNWQMSFSPLCCEGKTLQPDYETYIEWFHSVEGQFVPDMLIPYEKSKLPFKIPLYDKYYEEQKAGAIWVDLFIPEKASKGRYQGSLKITANKKEYDFKIKLKVYSCMTPFESRVIADLNNYADNISPNFPKLANNKSRYSDGSYFETEKQFITMSREHRCVFQNLNYLHSGKPVESFAPEIEGSGKNIHIKSWEQFDRHFGQYLDGSAFKNSKRGEIPIEFMFTPFNLGWPANYEKWGDKGFKTEYRRILTEFAQHFEEMGWTKTTLEIMFNHKKEYRFFPSTQDEIWYHHDEEIVDYMYDVMKDITEHSTAKFVFRADSSSNYGSHFERYKDVFTMWVAATTMFGWFPESVPVMKNNKNVLWIYGWYGEGMTVDLPLNAFLTQPMICFMTGATGFCSFWNAVSWGENYLETPFVNAGQSLFYPGGDFCDDDIIPSIRIKTLRNQMQLTDLMMTADGLDTETYNYIRKNLEQAVNTCFGYQSNEDWWSEKPPYLNIEPRYWDFDSDEYKKNHYIGKSPKILENLRQMVYEIMG